MSLMLIISSSQFCTHGTCTNIDVSNLWACAVIIPLQCVRDAVWHLMPAATRGV